jgi:hypothetical protein
MWTPPSARSREAGRSDAAAHLAAFGRELFDGGLRWLATVLTVATALVLIGMYTGVLPAETYWPVRARGTTAALLAGFALAFWTVIAVLNWRAHAKRRLRM